MADEIAPVEQPTITNPPPVETQGENPTEKRIKALSGKVETTANERDAALARADAADKKAAFADSFLDIIATNPSAKDHKTEIEAKVMGGYSVADATYAVLGPLGKLGNQPTYAPITGGSAPTTISAQGSKPYNEMNREELRAAFLSAQDKGDIALT